VTVETYLQDAYTLLRKAEDAGIRERKERDEIHAALSEIQGDLAIASQDLSHVMGSALRLAEEEGRIGHEIQLLNVLAGNSIRVSDIPAGSELASGRTKNLAQFLQSTRGRLQGRLQDEKSTTIRAVAHIDVLSKQLSEEQERYVTLVQGLQESQADHSTAELVGQDKSKSDDPMYRVLKQELLHAHSAGASAVAARDQEHLRNSHLVAMLERVCMSDEDTRARVVHQGHRIQSCSTRVHARKLACDERKAELKAVRNRLQDLQSQVHLKSSQQLVLKQNMQKQTCLQARNLLRALNIWQMQRMCSHAVRSWKHHLIIGLYLLDGEMSEHLCVILTKLEEESRIAAVDAYQNEEMLMKKLRALQKAKN